MTLKTDLADAVVSRRRLKILGLLADAVAYTLDEIVLQDSLALSGSPVSAADLRDDLRHLRDRDCLHVETPGGIWLATLTRTGNEVAMGLAAVEGVARPGPGA